jgi:ribosomal protein L37AE/L43A
MARAKSRISVSFERGSSATIESPSIRIEAPSCSARKCRRLIGRRVPNCKRCDSNGAGAGWICTLRDERENVRGGPNIDNDCRRSNGDGAP